MEDLTIEDINNIKALISVAPIKGIESTTVALLLQKIESIKNKKEGALLKQVEKPK